MLRASAGEWSGVFAVRITRVSDLAATRKTFLLQEMTWSTVTEVRVLEMSIEGFSEWAALRLEMDPVASWSVLVFTRMAVVLRASTTIRVVLLREGFSIGGVSALVVLDLAVDIRTILGHWGV